MTKRIKTLCVVIFTLLVCTGTVSAYSGEIKTVELTAINQDGIYKTQAETVGEFLEEVGIEVEEGDYVSKDLNQVVKSNDEIEVVHSMRVILNVDGVQRITQTTEKTVGEFLQANKNSIGSDYELIELKESTKMRNEMTIEVVTSKEVVSTVFETIPYETEYVENAEMLAGTQNVVTAGVEGVNKVTIKDIYEGTKIIQSEEITSVSVKNVVNEIVEIGTKEALSVDGHIYKEAVTVVATGYTPFDEGCTGITASGTVAKRGSIAVDTRVFPFGTKFYIPGYGVGVAEDRGGAIKGNKIDLCYETKSEAFNWGVREVKVYILE